MQNRPSILSQDLYDARPGLFTCILISAAAFAACAGPTGSAEGGAGGSRPTSSSAESAGGGGAGDVGGGGGAGGGGPVNCKPGAVQECYSGPQGTLGVGACVAGKQTCKPDGSAFGPCENEVTPTDETCSTPGDDDCDGVANNMGADCACTPAAIEPCYSGPMGTEGVGACKGGTRTCNGLGTEWSACEGEVKPAPEVCGNTSDDDCDGSACAAPLWSLIYGGAAADQASGIAIDAAGFIYVSGTFAGTLKIGNDTLTSAGGTDAYLAKFDGQGALQWSQRFGDAADQGATGVAVDAANNIILGGYFSGALSFGNTNYNGSGRDGFVAKFGPTGAFLWGKKIGAAGNQSVLAVATDASSSVLVTGAFEGNLSCVLQNCISSQGAQDIFVYKFSDQGAQTWLKVFGDPADQSPSAIAVDSAGSVILVGQLKGNSVDFGGGTPLGSAGGADAFVAKLGPNGAHVWSKRFGDPLDQQALGVAVGPSDGIAITGTFASTINFGALDVQSNGLNDIFIAKFGADGTYEWDKSYGDSADQIAQGAVFDASGDLLVTGGFQGAVNFGGGVITSLVSYDVFLLRLSATGAHVWSRSFGDTSSQIGRSIAREASTGNIVFSTSTSGTIDFGLGVLTSAGGDDVTLVKMSP